MAIDGKERVKANRLRAKLDGGKPVDEADAAWLSDYDRRVAESRKASEKIVHTEERHLAEGDASIDNSHLFAKEEGRRLDYLVDRATSGLERALVAHERMSEMLIDKVGSLMTNQAVLLESINSHYLARTEAEAQLLKIQLGAAGKDGEDEDESLMGMLKMIMEQIQAGKAGGGEAK